MKINEYYCKHCNKSFYIEAEGMNYEHMWCPRCRRRANLTESEIKWEKKSK